MTSNLRRILNELHALVQGMPPKDLQALTPSERRLVAAIRTAQNLYDKPDEDAERVTLVQTNPAHPETYNAFVDGKQVGHLRLRHSHFRVDYPMYGGATIYQGTPRGDGSFFDDERDFYLMTAKLSILAHLRKHSEDPETSQ
jgi:hypothetical protein